MYCALSRWSPVMCQLALQLCIQFCKKRRQVSLCRKSIYSAVFFQLSQLRLEVTWPIQIFAGQQSHSHLDLLVCAVSQNQSRFLRALYALLADEIRSFTLHVMLPQVQDLMQDCHKNVCLGTDIFSPLAPIWLKILQSACMHVVLWEGLPGRSIYACVYVCVTCQIYCSVCAYTL